MSVDIKIPAVVRSPGGLEKFSREVRTALAALRDREEAPPLNSSRALPFQAIPQGDNTVRIAPGAIMWVKGTDDMIGQSYEAALSSAITVVDGDTIWLDLDLDPDIETIHSDTFSPDEADEINILETYHAYPSGTPTVTYTARAADPTATVTNIDSLSAITLHLPVARFNVVSSVATIDYQFLDHNVFLPYVVHTHGILPV